MTKTRREEAMDEIWKILTETFNCKVCKKFSKYNLVSRDKKICENCYKGIQEAWYEACSENGETINVDDFIDAYLVRKELINSEE